MFIYTVYLREYDGGGSSITHVKSFKSLTGAEIYSQELKRNAESYDYETDVCIVMNELW